MNSCRLIWDIFFIALSINDENLLAVIELYALLASGIFLSKSQYFNPLFLVMGYHFYYVVVEKKYEAFSYYKRRCDKRF